MKILAYVHGYPPNLNAGAEMMLHQILLDLKSRGHQVTVMTQNPGAREYEGIRISDSSLDIYEKLFEWCDIVITHLNLTKDAVELGKKYEKKIVHIVHNDFVYFLHKDYKFKDKEVLDKDAAHLVIANSEWIKNSINPALDTIVVNPPTNPEKYSCDTDRRFITLVNLAEDKGSSLFWEIAKRMPGEEFLGVKGGWGKQITPKRLNNATVMGNTTNTKSFYGLTKILVMPSYYESWGRVAIEASCSGIPVVAAATSGLKESLGYAGIFVNGHNPDDWIKAIKSLDDPDVYAKYSKATKKRSAELANIFVAQMDLLENKLLGILDK